MKSLCGVLLLLTLAAACRREEAPPLRPVVAVKSETPAADKILAEAEDDPSWIAGTWKKEGEDRWLLFNLPGDAAELAGKPPRVVRRGKLSMHGRYVSAVFSDVAYDLEATATHAELSGAPGRYRRGAPP